MPYQANIPQPNDQLSASQVDLLGNFQALGVIGGNTNANSSALNNIAGFNYIYLPVQGANPPVGTAFANEIAMFSFLNPTTNQNELYINKRNLATIKQIPITASVLSNTAVNAATNGWSFLPSGILIKWGATTTAAATNIDIVSGGPAYARVYNAQATLFNNSPGNWFITFTQAPNPMIQINGLGAAAQYYYFIIGAGA